MIARQQPDRELARFIRVDIALDCGGSIPATVSAFIDRTAAGKIEHVEVETAETPSGIDIAAELTDSELARVAADVWVQVLLDEQAQARRVA